MFRTALYVCLFAVSSQASTLFDGSLASPSASAFAGWYDGTGNPNGGFTIDLENGIELGLRVKLRQSPNVINTPTDLYDVPNGPQLSSPSHAAWNYEFSIDLEPNGIGTLTMADIDASLTIIDLTTSATATIDPLTYFPDDSAFGPSGKETPQQGTDWGAQNSENPAFASFPLAAGYNENAGDLYQFTLAVTNAAHTSTLATDTIMVQVVTPEPAAAGLFGLGIAAIALISRRTAYSGREDKSRHRRSPASR